MAVSWLKHKYAIGRDYKNMKSKPRTNASSSKNKGSNKKQVKPIGEVVMLVNMSDNREYCAGTGRLLPRYGTVIRHEGKLYSGRSAIPK